MSRDGIVMAEILVVSAAWMLLSILFCGVGSLARRAYRSHVVDKSDLLFDWWVGWALTVVFLLLWHFVMPITVWTFAPIAAAGVAGAWLAREDWKRAVQPMLGNSATLAALAVLAWLTIAAMTFGPDRQYDTALYHLQSVRWAQAYPVLPGLANVDHRFAMNSLFFLFSALVETVRIHGNNLRLAAGLLFLPLIVQGIVTVHGAAVGRQKMDVLRWFHALMIPVALWQARHYASTLSPDGVVFVIAVVLSAEVLRIIRNSGESPAVQTSGLDWDYRIFGITLLAIIGVTVKVSFAIFAVSAVAVALWAWWRLPLTLAGSTRQWAASRLARCALVIFPAVIVAALWMAHGVVLSGYIAFPATIGAFPVDWRLSQSLVEYESDWIVAWARSPGTNPREVLGNYDWVPRWLAATARDRDAIGAALALMLAAGLRFASRTRRRQSRNTGTAHAYVFLLPSLIYVTLWLVTAPAIRFALGPLWVIAVGTLALSVAGSGYAPLDVPRMRIFGPAALALMLGTACAVAFAEVVRPPAPQPVKRMTTLSGLTVYVPAEGDRCGDAPLPCSSKPPDERLELRHPGTFVNGFRIAR